MIAIVLAFIVSPSKAAVLTSIIVDGNMGDWTAVLADPFQTSLDGPLGPLPDLDAPLSAASRDAVRFAWTYDSTDFYFHITRAVAASGRNWYFLYIDTNADGLMRTGEPVVHLTWWGNARFTRTSFYQYNAVAPGGDALGGATCDWTTERAPRGQVADQPPSPHTSGLRRWTESAMLSRRAVGPRGRPAGGLPESVRTLRKRLNRRNAL